MVYAVWALKIGTRVWQSQTVSVLLVSVEVAKPDRRGLLSRGPFRPIPHVTTFQSL